MAKHTGISEALGEESCIACGGGLEPAVAAWHRRCRRCGYETARLAVAINADESGTRLDEAERATGLKQLRQGNFAVILSTLAGHMSKRPATLLEVGCAHGWFLEMARTSFDAVGVEPDERMCRITRASGLPVRLGFFPDVLTPDERFDVIVFNDVIEHIPDIRAALASCAASLNADGLLCLNLPNSRGFFYRTAKLLAALGLRGAFERMWQVGLPSPHLHYFDEANLRTLVEQAGFRQIEVRSLPSVSRHGLLQRIRYAGDASSLKVWLLYFGVLLATPFIRAFPSDISVSIFRRAPET